MTRHLPNDDDISAFRQALQAAKLEQYMNYAEELASLVDTLDRAEMDKFCSRQK